jgi:hypothetical protein
VVTLFVLMSSAQFGVYVPYSWRKPRFAVHRLSAVSHAQPLMAVHAVEDVAAAQAAVVQMPATVDWLVFFPPVHVQPVPHVDCVLSSQHTGPVQVDDPLFQVQL